LYAFERGEREVERERRGEISATALSSLRPSRTLGYVSSRLSGL